MGRLEQTSDMRTPLIFLACLLVIAAKDCMQHCNVAKREKDCATCIWNHQDYDKVWEGDCKDSCRDPSKPECHNSHIVCIENHKDFGLACWTGMNRQTNDGEYGEQCNKKAEVIAAKDCKQHCNVAKRGRECATCIWNHQDYDKVCQGDTIAEQCGKTIDKIWVGDCKDSCSDPSKPECHNSHIVCIENHKDFG